MNKQIIYQKELLVSGIMCHQGCGAKIHRTLSDLKALKDLIPGDCELKIDAEPEALGVHRLVLTLESKQILPLDENLITAHFKTQLQHLNFEVLEDEKTTLSETSKHSNFINIVINLLSLGLMTALSLAVPPSLPLTIGLTLLSFITTAYTARHHLKTCFEELREKKLNPMSTPITLGWLLSLAHTLYHAITMPLMQNSAMNFMNYFMPVLLITIVNAMDEIKRRILLESTKMHIKGLKTLFPHMPESYEGYALSDIATKKLSEIISSKENSTALQNLLQEARLVTYSKKILEKGMLILVKRGDCFPVDGILLQGHTLIDASILTGEPHQTKKTGDKIPGGSINLSQDVLLYVTENTYNSTVNRLLFRSNRAYRKPASLDTPKRFSYVYLGLISLGLISAIALPIALGIATIPLILQNVIGILFAICPCTIAIAHQLPKLLSIYKRHQQGIILRREALAESTVEPHTIVFDKTGTLTTGKSIVHDHVGISPALWQKIYLLEALHGANHPVALAIADWYKKNNKTMPLFKDVQHEALDKEHRGLTAVVQGKRIHIGNLSYLKASNIPLPSEFSKTITQKIALGLTPIYVAENGIYQGMMLIQHEIRPHIRASLQRLKREGKTLIMLTGDDSIAAQGLNQQLLQVFDQVHAAHTPQMKETFLKNLMNSGKKNPLGTWFIGDGLNDAPCARIVSDQGGISAAITHKDKAAFFTDLSLNGSIDYLFEHHRLNQFLKKNIAQNQGLLIYSALIFLAFILGCSGIGIAVSPILPLLVMVSTTLLTLLNTYRITLADTKPSSSQSVSKPTKPSMQAIHEKDLQPNDTQKRGKLLFFPPSKAIQTTESVLKNNGITTGFDSATTSTP